MPKYVITLPREIPFNYFNRLDGNVHDGIIRRLESAYGEIEKEGFLSSSSPREALSNYFFRCFSERPITARSLTKMFSPDVAKYVKEYKEHFPEIREIREETAPNKPLEKKAEQLEFKF